MKEELRTHKQQDKLVKELEVFSKNEIKDERNLLTEKQSYHQLVYAVLNQVKEDLKISPKYFRRKVAKLRTKKFTFKNTEDYKKAIIEMNRIASDNQLAQLDAESFIDDGRLDLYVALIDPEIDTRKLKEEFRKCLRKNIS